MKTDRKKIKIGDVVSWKSGNKLFYGHVMETEGDSALVDMFCPNHWGEERSILLSKLRYEPPVAVTREDLRRFCRFEITYTQLMQHRSYAEMLAPERYGMTLGDLKAAVAGFLASGADNDTFADEYFWPLWDGNNGIDDATGFWSAYDRPDDDTCTETGLPDQYSVFSDVWEILDYRFGYGEKETDLNEVIRIIDLWEKNSGKPIAEWELTKQQKMQFIRFWNDDRLRSADDAIRTLYRKTLDGLCEENDIEALRVKAYACYGNGNAVYGQDWHASLACLLRLMELEPDPQIANTLGYMYYYGRCTDGVPEYDKAFYYFSIGAAGWYYESRYKLSDMFRHGYGVAKNPKAAAALIWEVYGEQLDKIRHCKFKSNFADVALRAGNLMKEGIDCIPSPDDAYYYYLQAQFAIRMRMLAEDNYGDRKVAEGIRQAIEDTLPETSYIKPKKTVHFRSMYFLLQNALRKKHHLEMKLKRVSETQARLSFRIVPFENETNPPKMFVTVPSAAFCGLLEKLTVDAKKIERWETFGKEDAILFDSISGTKFFRYGRPVADIAADFVFSAPRNTGKTYRFASVMFEPGGKKYDYLCDLPLREGDRAIVRTDNGETVVTVQKIFEKTVSELKLPLKRYKKILRLTD